MSASAAHAADGDAASEITVSAGDWPWWRGFDRNGIARNQSPPVTWSESENIRWRAPLPGRSHGSATVVGKRVFITAAEEDEDRQSVLCFDRDSGEPLWRTVIHEGGLAKDGNKKASQASTTVACDGARLFVNFLNSGAVSTTCLDLDGNELWETKISDYVVHQGYGSSPALYGPLVIVSADNKGGGAIAGLNRVTGDVVWRKERPATPNYSSPVILTAHGREQLIFIGCNLVASHDPLTGESLWEFPGATTECVTSTVTDGNVVITSGGYPRNHVAAVRADGSGKTAWEKENVRVYVPSLLFHDGALFATLDEGLADCWDCASGEELWKARLGGTFSSSPVLADGRIYATNESGETFVYRASREGFDLLATNQLGDNVFATPAASNDCLFQRVAKTSNNGARQEWLYCIGEAAKLAQ